MLATISILVCLLVADFVAQQIPHLSVTEAQTCEVMFPLTLAILTLTNLLLFN